MTVTGACEVAGYSGAKKRSGCGVHSLTFSSGECAATTGALTRRRTPRPSPMPAALVYAILQSGKADVFIACERQA